MHEYNMQHLLVAEQLMLQQISLIKKQKEKKQSQRTNHDTETLEHAIDERKILIFIENG